MPYTTTSERHLLNVLAEDFEELNTVMIDFICILRIETQFRIFFNSEI